MATSLAMLLAIQVSGASLATRGSAILGVNDAIDGDALTRVDTWNGDSPDTVSYVGILWSRPIARAVTRVQLNLAIFSDGGRFGVNGVGPGAGGTLSAAVHLAAPTIQSTTSGGLEWRQVSHISDYTIALHGQPLPATDHAPPTAATATIELLEPIAGINGLHVIGPEGGTASKGFLDVFELVVEALPPTLVQPVVRVNPRSNGTQFEFGFNSQMGVTHVVRSNANMDDEWQVYRTVAGDGRYQTVMDTADERQRFCQVVSE